MCERCRVSEEELAYDSKADNRDLIDAEKLQMAKMIMADDPEKVMAHMVESDECMDRFNNFVREYLSKRELFEDHNSYHHHMNHNHSLASKLIDCIEDILVESIYDEDVTIE